MYVLMMMRMTYVLKVRMIMRMLMRMMMRMTY